MTLRIQLASDLHLELLERVRPGSTVITPAADADLLVLAGDVSNGVRGIEMFGDWPTPVLYVAGNHEFYHRDLEQTRAELRRAAEGTSVVFLDDDVADLSQFTAWYEPRRYALQGIRFLGATLWTDYRLERSRTQRQAMENAERRLNDHLVIRNGDGLFTAAHALENHTRSRTWLEQQLACPFDGTTVVITHHGVHRLSVHPRYAGDLTNAAFVSDLSGLLPRASLWMHGHVHDSFDYVVAGCRVVANPLGYLRGRPDAAASRESTFENPEFRRSCVIDVPTPDAQG